MLFIFLLISIKMHVCSVWRVVAAGSGCGQVRCNNYNIDFLVVTGWSFNTPAPPLQYRQYRKQGNYSLQFHWAAGIHSQRTRLVPLTSPVQSCQPGGPCDFHFKRCNYGNYQMYSWEFFYYYFWTVVIFKSWPVTSLIRYIDNKRRGEELWVCNVNKNWHWTIRHPSLSPCSKAANHWT